MSSFYTTPAPVKDGLTLEAPSETKNANIVALNACPAIKAAKALDNLSFALNALENVGSITPTDAEMNAFKTLCQMVTNAQPYNVTVPKGMDKTAVQALTALITSASSNSKSAFLPTAAGITIVVAGK